MKKLLLILLCLPLIGLGQDQYSKNSHVSISSRLEGSNYKFEYTFKDHFNQLHNIWMTFDKENAHKNIEKLGIPKYMFDSYTIYENTEYERKKILSDGLYRKKGNLLTVDYNAVVNYYRSYFESVSNYLIEYLQKEGKDSRLNRIELVMKFVQDIPYGVPTEKDNYKYDDGIYAPHELLLRGYGDCDSKTFLFVCIVSYMINTNDILFVRNDNHVLSAIQSDKQHGTYFTHKRNKYYICETAGPGRSNFGYGGDLDGSFYLEEFELKQ